MSRIAIKAGNRTEKLANVSAIRIRSTRGRFHIHSTFAHAVPWASYSASHDSRGSPTGQVRVGYGRYLGVGDWVVVGDVMGGSHGG